MYYLKLLIQCYPLKNDIFNKPSSAPTSKSRENYKSPIPPRIININFENLPVINDSSKINTVKRGVIRLKKMGINRQQHRPLSQNSPRFSPQMINQYNQINKRLETDEKNLFKNYKQDPNLEFMSKLKFILQSKTNIIDTVLYNMEQNNF